MLRTEATGELNTAITPKSITDHTPTLRVVFLGSKQKAPETRAMRAELEEYFSIHELFEDNKYKVMEKCEFQKDLCCTCPRCILMGAAIMGKANIKHRAIYKTAYSLLPFEELETPITFNAINDASMKTGQALGAFNTITGSTLVPSIVSIQGMTEYEFALLIKTIIKTKDYGARTATFGSVRNNFVGIVAGLEQIITPLELTLELYQAINDKKDISVNTTKDILEKYKGFASTPDKVKVFTSDEIINTLKGVRDWNFFDSNAKDDVIRMCDHALAFGKTVRG